MEINDNDLIKKIVRASRPVQDDITYAEKMYGLWLKYNVTDNQAEMLSRAKLCGPDAVSNSNGSCI